MAVSQGHAITGHYAAIGVETVGAAAATCGNDDRFGLDHAGDAVLDIETDYALDAIFLYQQIEAEVLIKTLDGGVLDGGLKQGVQHVET